MAKPFSTSGLEKLACQIAKLNKRVSTNYWYAFFSSLQESASHDVVVRDGPLAKGEAEFQNSLLLHYQSDSLQYELHQTVQQVISRGQLTERNCSTTAMNLPGPGLWDGEMKDAYVSRCDVKLGCESGVGTECIAFMVGYDEDRSGSKKKSNC
eukprot:2200257-Amphidinium_carterae.1